MFGFFQLYRQSGGEWAACSETKPRGQSSHPQPDLGRSQGDLGTFQPGEIHYCAHCRSPPHTHTQYGADLRHHRNCLFKRNHVFLIQFQREEKFGMQNVSSLKPSFPHQVLEFLIFRALKYQRLDLDGGSGRVQWIATEGIKSKQRWVGEAKGQEWVTVRPEWRQQLQSPPFCHVDGVWCCKGPGRKGLFLLSPEAIFGRRAWRDLVSLCLSAAFCGPGCSAHG